MKTIAAKILYRDVTADPDGEARAAHGLSLRQALADLGFARICLLEGRAPGLLPPEELRRIMARPDADMLIDGIENGVVNEILAGPRREAFATVDWHFGAPVLCLQTISEDGVIVDTTMKPKRGPRPAERKPWQVGRLFLRLLTIALDQPPLWPRRNRPRSGYYLELVDTDDVAALWQRHQERVHAILESTGARIPAHDSLQVYLCIEHRVHHITDHDPERWYLDAGLGAYALAVLLTLVPLEFHGGVDRWLATSASHPLSFIGSAASVLAAAYLAMLATIRLARALGPRLPGLPLEPLPTLSAAVRSLYGTMVPMSPEEAE